jgi:hypothetical protein
VCPEHGAFLQRPHNHIFGRQGCPQCGLLKALRRKKVLAARQFYDTARSVHGNRYDYSKVNYENAKTNVEIICPIHGEFSQTPDSHTQGAGCAKCAGVQKISQAEYIERANEVHNNRYLYTELEYVNAKEKVTIICPEHGPFRQMAYNHLMARGCPSCATSGFDKDKPAILYYLSVAGGLAYKIGITNRSVNERYLGEMDAIEVLKTWEFEIGSDALKQERQILDRFSSDFYMGPALLSSGNTELFSRDVLGIVKSKGAGIIS